MQDLLAICQLKIPLKTHVSLSQGLSDKSREQQQHHEQVQVLQVFARKEQQREQREDTPVSILQEVLRESTQAADPHSKGRGDILQKWGGKFFYFIKPKATIV